MSADEILYDVDDGVCTVTLNRPHKLNAVTSEVVAQLIAAFDRADGDDGVRAVIVTGAGRAFCAGADLSSGGKTFDREARGSQCRPPSTATAAGRSPCGSST
jgi:enoyl-CoA hydratase/carnithine racemase